VLARPGRKWLIAATATVVLLATVAPARADAADAVSVPLHARAADVTLIGASTTGVAVLQDGATEADADVVQTGGWGQRLEVRPQVDTHPEGFGEGFAVGQVSGTDLAWAITTTHSSSVGSALSRTDLLTGSTVLDGGVSGADFALVGQGSEQAWLSMPNWWSYFPQTSPGLLKEPVATAPGKTATEWSGITEVSTSVTTRSALAWDADGSEVVVAMPVDVPGADSWEHAVHMVGIPLGGGLPRDLSVPSTTTVNALSDLELGLGTMAWSSQDDPGSGMVWTMPRSGGVPVGHTETDSKAELENLAVTDSGVVGYLIPKGDASVTLRTIADGIVQDTVLPDGSAGLAAVRNDFVTATGRGPAPGVYRIAPDSDPTLAATFASPEYSIGGWDLNAGTLYYSDLSKGSGTKGALWSRRVGDNLALGNEKRATVAAGAGPYSEVTLPVSFSGARGLVGNPKYGMQWDLLDRGRRITSIEQAPVKGKYGLEFPIVSDAKVSGPYALIGGQIHRSDGELLHLLPTAARRAEQDDLFGSTVIYGTTSAKKGQVWTVDVEKPRPAKLSEQACGHAPQVAIWGRTAAWLSCDASRASVRDLVAKSTRTIVTGIDPGTAPADIDLTMGEGTLAWVADGQAAVLDLSDATSVPVPLPGTTISLALDGGLVARLTNVEKKAPDLAVTRLPFDVASHPRLTGTVRTLGFSPDGDQKRDTWTPSFDSSEPLSSATLTLVSESSGRTVRTFTTKDTADGGVRKLVWNGMTAAGRTVPQGYYVWTLTGNSREGVALTTATGGKVTGRVELAR
jgi:hypothetical protein